MDAVVYRTQRRLRPDLRRIVCQVPVFQNGQSATKNSLIASGHSLIVENNYGYQDPLVPQASQHLHPRFRPG